MGFKELTVLVALVSSSIVWAAAGVPDLTKEYQMPASEVIAERVMKDMECLRFLHETKFHMEVGGKKCSVVQAVLALDSALYVYAQKQLPQDVDDVRASFGAHRRREIVRTKVLQMVLLDIPGAYEQNESDERRRRSSIRLQSEMVAEMREQNIPQPSPKTSGFACTIL